MMMTRWWSFTSRLRCELMCPSGGHIPKGIYGDVSQGVLVSVHCGLRVPRPLERGGGGDAEPLMRYARA